MIPTITTIESVGGTANYDALMAIVEEYNSTAAILQIKSDKLLEKTDPVTFNYDSCLKDMRLFWDFTKSIPTYQEHPWYYKDYVKAKIISNGGSVAINDIL